MNSLEKEVLKDLLCKRTQNINMSVVGNSRCGMSYAALHFYDVLKQYTEEEKCRLVSATDLAGDKYK